MKALVHFPSLDEAPVGIWWVDTTTGEPVDYYTDPDSSDTARGKTTVWQKTDKAVSWESWFQQLADRTPTFANYELIDVPADRHPMGTLKALQAQAESLLRKK